MAKVTEIYERYKIMPQLQLHQLRVAAVAKQICDNAAVAVDTDAVITACLLHDMGNIIKFDLGYFPQYLQPEDQEYWQGVKEEFIVKYGHDEHHATIAIARDLGVEQKIIKYIDSVGFKKIEGNYFSGSLEQKICNYCDMRVGPHGIVSVSERMADGAKRYQHRKDYFIRGQEREFIQTKLMDVERQIFSNCKIKPDDITDESSGLIIEELKSYEIDAKKI